MKAYKEKAPLNYKFQNASNALQLRARREVSINLKSALA